MILLLTAALAGSTTAAMAGPPAGHPLAGGFVDAHLARMTEQLSLSDSQQAEIRAILDEQHQQCDRERQAMRERIDAVLTPEQIALRDQALAQRMERRLDRMAERLDLSAAQRDEMSALLQEKRANPQITRSEMRERIAAILTDEQRAQLRDGRRGGPGHPGPRF
jgi:Spy/CpxP family protein refolding chaperone